MGGCLLRYYTACLVVFILTAARVGGTMVQYGPNLWTAIPLAAAVGMSIILGMMIYRGVRKE